MKKEKKLTKYEKDMLEYLKSRVLTDEQVKELNDKLCECKYKINNMDILVKNGNASMYIPIIDICDAMIIALKESEGNSYLIEKLTKAKGGYSEIYKNQHKIEQTLDLNDKIKFIIMETIECSDYGDTNLTHDIYKLRYDAHLLSFALDYPEFKRYCMAIGKK